LSRTTKNTSRKIAILVGIQIAIILVSFIILAIFESQKTFSGNAVNIAGKNRYLTSLVLNEVTKYYIGGQISGDPYSALDEYEKNLHLLKNGGMQNDIHLSPLPDKFHMQWNNVMIYL
jgi:hypothetical protein